MLRYERTLEAGATSHEDGRMYMEVSHVAKTHGTGTFLLTEDRDPATLPFTVPVIVMWHDDRPGLLHVVLATEDVRHLSHNDRINHRTQLEAAARRSRMPGWNVATSS